MGKVYNPTSENISDKDLEPSTRRLCDACHGTGYIEEDIGDEYVKVDCAACGGSGYDE